MGIVQTPISSYILSPAIFARQIWQCYENSMHVQLFKNSAIIYYINKDI